MTQRKGRQAQESRGAVMVAAILEEMTEAGVEPDAKETALLEAARQVVDRIDALEAIVARDGELVTLANGSQRMHPAVSEHRQLCATLPKVLQGIVVGDTERSKDPVKQRAAQVRWARQEAAQAARAVARG